MTLKLTQVFSWTLLILICLICKTGYSQISKDTIAADSYYKKGDSLLYYRNYKESVIYFEKAISIYKNTRSWSQLADSHNKISGNYISTFNFEKTIYHAERALAISETRIPDNAKVKAATLDNIGTYHRISGSDFAIALDYYNKAFRLRSENLTKDHLDFAISYFNLGTVYTNKGLYKEALEYFEKALEIRRKTSIEETIEISEIYRQIGNVFYEQGLYDDTLAYLEKALGIANKIYKSDNFYFVDLYNNIGLMYNYKNEYNRALEYYIKSLHLSELQLGADHPDQVRMHYNIANIYYAQKIKEKSLFHLDKTIKICLQAFGDDFPNLALPYSLKGLLIRGEEGVSYIKKALVLARKVYGENNVRTAYFYSYLGELYHEIDQYEKAFEYANKGLDIRLKIFGEHNFYVVESYNLIATFEISKKQYKKALDYLEKAILANKQPDNIVGIEQGEFDMFLSPTRLLTSLERKAFVLNTLHKKENDVQMLKESATAYEKASRLIEMIRRTQFNKEDKMTFARDAKNVFFGNISTQLLLDPNTNESISSAFNYSEKSKAGFLKDLLNEANAKGYSNLPKELLVLEKNLRKVKADATSKLSQQKTEKSNSDTNISAVENEILDISRKQDSLKTVLEKEYPKYYQLKYESEVVSIVEIQNKLNENATFLEYFVEQNTVYAFIITKNTAVVEELSIAELDKKIENFRKSITLKNTDEYIKEGLQLYNELISPIRKNFRGEHLIIVPDESLWYLNFDLMLTTEPEKDVMNELPYLLYEYAISYANSANILFRSHNRRTKENQLRKECLAFSFSNEDDIGDGDVLDFEKFRNSKEDLPGTRNEIRAIANIVKGNYFFGSEAVESNFKKNANQYSILHLALHGEVDNENPGNSRIYFTKAKDSIEDNLLYSHELYALNIPSDLTVLTACNTGVGKIAKGEGVLSLGTAFQYAGTKSLLLTSWEVPDKTTPDVMKNFYQNLNNGMDKASALQQAKIQYIKTADVFTNHPLYWGAFYVLGDNSPLEIDSPASSNWMLYFIIGLSSIAILLIFRKKLIRSFF
ncbi:CHAT domain-containing protein [Aquimarina sp. BL5]|uniref:CHAT domain-containing protein n=1 Tax=Aquimarina sp. BL5 TaxID=1714860 RepID=UPI000E52FF57|nr:CHAT domain-containing tetratricopeptide repeat protein [Aquimarina sp. BL5]AXT51625.1 CHAT domain-containing protein [Aquimarina sp. BL5]RKN08523.1 CHAT domain-containing protein [Aquimarina sp. BL5]